MNEHMMIDGQQAGVARILLLEDSPFDAELIGEHLNRMEPAPILHRASSRKEYLDALSQGRFDVILADYSLPGFDGMSALQIAREQAPSSAFIFVSGVLGEEVAIESFRKGATDYVLKQRLIRLPAAVERALAEVRGREQRRRAEEQKDLLVHELSHRVKNTLAVVMSTVRRTARGVSSVDDFEERLLSRLQAMADAHSLLFEVNWGATPLRRVIRRILEAFRRDGAGTFELTGPDVPLDPKEALALGMIVHELATNAAKYGALSASGGQVLVSWQTESGDDGVDQLEVIWQETGGPAVTQPVRNGFGTTLISRSVTHELGGNVDMDFAEAGLRCRLRFPLARHALPMPD
jgi:two-component sensor histidine kinase